MKLTAKVKLLPDTEQRAYLLETLERANAACDYISGLAWQAKVFSPFQLQKQVYADVRQRFDLSAQVVIRLLSKVSDAYKLDKQTKRQFRKHGAIAYDSRILNWRLPDNTVSIWLLGGRETIPFVTGEPQRFLLQYQHGESDLVYRKGKFYLYTTCDVPDEAPIDPEGWLGVDLGIVNIAVDSDGEIHSASAVNNVRFRHRRLRTKLQAKGTLGARRRLKKLAGKERRFASHTNHVISKHIVAKAQGTQRGIALEELTHIRMRITARKPRRATLSSWSFFQLRSFITYKAQRVGIPVVAVDPRNTSRTCPTCGHIDKANRPAQSVFSCTQCGLVGLPDYVAAIEISRRGAVNHPYCSDDTAVSAPEQSPSL
jgi:IS605 OrfB family transposase